VSACQKKSRPLSQSAERLRVAPEPDASPRLALFGTGDPEVRCLQLVEERKRSAVGRARRDYPQLKQRSHLIPAKCGTPNVARGSVKTGAWGSKEKGYQRLVETFRWVGHRFTGGMLIPADIVSFESGDLAYTVGFERGEVSVDANAPASMTIRVTHIYRRIDGEWYLVHRHADFPPSDQRARDQGA
jgi:hypothetical protein